MNTMEVDDSLEQKIYEDMKNAASMGIVLGIKLKKKLQKLAEREDRSVSSIIRILISEALEARNMK